MIKFNFSLDNPFSNRWNTICFKNGLAGQQRAWEFNTYATHQVVAVDFNLHLRGDHPGVQIFLGLLGYAVEFCFYDTRHKEDI